MNLNIGEALELIESRSFYSREQLMKLSVEDFVNLYSEIITKTAEVKKMNFDLGTKGVNIVFDYRKEQEDQDGYTIKDITNYLSLFHENIGISYMDSMKILINAIKLGKSFNLEEK